MSQSTSTTITSSGAMSIPKFDGKNWKLFKVKIQACFMAQGLMETIGKPTGTESGQENKDVDSQAVPKKEGGLKQPFMLYQNVLFYSVRAVKRIE